jgi:hypothetical protein
LEPDVSILSNYQLQHLTNLGNPEFSGDPDGYAELLYKAIRIVPVDATPRLVVKVALRLRNGKSVTETVPFQVAEEEFTSLRLLIGHYLATYPTLHLLANEGRYLHACVVKTDEVTHVDIVGEKVEINDEDVRRSKFTAGSDVEDDLTKKYEEGDAVPPLAVSAEDFRRFATGDTTPRTQ